MYATRLLLHRILVANGSVELIYVGDRMWPAIGSGQVLRVVPQTKETAEVGTVVVASWKGIPDLFRVESHQAGRTVLRTDSEPEFSFLAGREEILGRVNSTRKRIGTLSRHLRRLRIDLREALGQAPIQGRDPAETVRMKYQIQAPYYAGVQGPEMQDLLRSWIQHRVPPGGKILVAGCGTGREAFALAREGWSVSGIDFSKTMIELAQKEAERRKLSVRFQVKDLRIHEELPGSLDAVFFTHDVYSFIPGAKARIDLLKRMARWISPHGVILLSARRAARAYERLILSLQWLAVARRRGNDWGSSHTRWIAPDGNIGRSFIHIFTAANLRRELREAGLTMSSSDGSHVILTLPHDS